MDSGNPEPLALLLFWYNFNLATMALSYYEQLNHPLWEKKKIEILEIYGHKCAVCGTELHKLEIHHLCYFPDLLIWEYDNELMVPICKKHHYELTYELPKISGLISLNCLIQNIDLNTLVQTLINLKSLNNGTR